MAETSGVSGEIAESGTRDPADLWRAFLGEHSPLILQVVHLFERDPDQVQDCFLFVCERLRRGDMRRIRRFRVDGTATFDTWLRAVVRRLCLDWRRHRDGRFRLPRAIARLPDLEREVFRCVHLRGLSENETFHTLKALRPALTREQLAGAASRVAENLTSRQSWLLLVRRPRLQSLSAAPSDADPAESEANLVDPRADPERDAVAHESLVALRDAIGRLPPRERLLIRLRYEQELPLEEVARLTGLSGAAQAERQIERALEAVRERIEAQGFTRLSVKEERRTP